MTEDHPLDDAMDVERAHGQVERRLRGALRSWLDPLEPPPPRAPVGRARLRATGLGTLGTIAAALLVAALVVGPRLAGQLGAPVRSPVPAGVQPGTAAAPSSTPESASPPPIGSAPCLAAGASGALCGAAASPAASGSTGSTAPETPPATVSVPVTGHSTATPATRTLPPVPAATPSVSSTPVSPIASPTPAGTAPAGQSSSITLADNGTTLHLGIGQQFLLDLGLTYDWTVNVADQQVVSRVPNILVIRGAQGVYEARAAGTTTLTAAGNPVCLSAKPPCAMPSLLFRLQIVVS